MKAGVKRDRAARTGPEPKYPFSGLLKCGTCGSNSVMAGKGHYACASRVSGGPSGRTSDAYLRRTMIEPGLVEGIKRARMELTEHVGPIRVRTTPDEIVLAAQKGHMEAALLRATGTDGTRQISLVAGARLWRCLLRLPRRGPR